MQSAKDAMMNMREEVNMQQNSYQAHVEAARVAELEAAQAAAQAALMAEMDLLRRQKHGAEQHARDLEEQVSLQGHKTGTSADDKHATNSMALAPTSWQFHTQDRLLCRQSALAIFHGMCTLMWRLLYSHQTLAMQMLSQTRS